MILFLV